MSNTQTNIINTQTNFVEEFDKIEDILPKSSIFEEINKNKNSVDKILKNTAYDELFISKKILQNDSNKIIDEINFISNNALHTEEFYERIENLKFGEVIQIKYGGDEFVFFFKDKIGKTKMLFVDVSNMGPTNKILGKLMYLGEKSSNPNIVDIYICEINKLASKYLGTGDIDLFFENVKLYGEKLLNMSKEEFDEFTIKYSIKAEYDTYLDTVKKTKNFANRRNTHRIFDKEFVKAHKDETSKYYNKNYSFEDKDNILIDYISFLKEKYSIEIDNNLNLNEQIKQIHDELCLRSTSGDKNLPNVNTTLLDIQGGLVDFEGKNYKYFKKALNVAENLEKKTKEDKIKGGKEFYFDSSKEDINFNENLKTVELQEYNELLELEIENQKILIEKDNIINKKDINFEKDTETLKELIKNYFDNSKKIDIIKHNNSRAPGYKSREYFFRELKELKCVKNYINDCQKNNEDIKNSDINIVGFEIEQENTGTLNNISYDLADSIPIILINIMNLYFGSDMNYIDLVKEGGGNIKIIGLSNILNKNIIDEILNTFNKEIDIFLKNRLFGEDLIKTVIDSVGRNTTKGQKESIGLGKFKLNYETPIVSSNIEVLGNIFVTMFSDNIRNIKNNIKNKEEFLNINVLLEDIERNYLRLKKIENFQIISFEQIKKIEFLLKNVIGNTKYNSLININEIINNYFINKSIDTNYTLLKSFQDINFIENISEEGSNCIGMSFELQKKLLMQGIKSYIVRFKAGGLLNNKYVGNGHGALILPRLNNGYKEYILLDPGLLISKPIYFTENGYCEPIIIGNIKYSVEKNDNLSEYPFKLLKYDINKDIEKGNNPIEIYFDPENEWINPNETINKDILRGMQDFKIVSQSENGIPKALLRINIEKNIINLKIGNNYIGYKKGFDNKGNEIINFSYNEFLNIKNNLIFKKGFDKLSSILLINSDELFSQVEKIILLSEEYKNNIWAPSTRKIYKKNNGFNF